MMSKKTVVLGASDNPGRYAYIATHRLLSYGHEVVPVGIRAGTIQDLPIQVGMPRVEDVDTVTLYVGTDRQSPYYEYIRSLKPKRVIFNPGTENDVLVDLCHQDGIETVEGCTLVMLSVGNY